MSITAFPVLARIIQERDLTKDHLGTLAITCAAVDDVTAWSLLAVVIAIVKAGDITSALLTIFFSVVYVMFMLFVVKRLLNKIAQTHFTRETVNKPILAILLEYFFVIIYDRGYWNPCFIWCIYGWSYHSSKPIVPSCSGGKDRRL
jgi:Kef-type K+ transport system membrane component KefB